MRSQDLKPAQVEQLARELGRQLRYINKLCTRMHRLRFPLEDPLWQSATAAREALRRLYAEAYAAGRPQALPPDTTVVPALGPAGDRSSISG